MIPSAEDMRIIRRVVTLVKHTRIGSEGDDMRRDGLETGIPAAASSFTYRAATASLSFTNTW